MSNMRRSRQLERQLETTVSTSFITKDTYISNDVARDDESLGSSTFLRVGRGTENIISQTLLDYFDSQLLPTGHSVTGLELCLHQYFSGSNAEPTDPFRINLINEPWDDDITTRTKPSTGIRIKSFIFNSTKGPKCIEFSDTEIAKLEEGYGIVISGRTAVEKKERYFTSSEWTSRSRDVISAASSTVYHPHWMVKSKPIANAPININNDDTPIMGEINIWKKPVYFILFFASIGCVMLAIGGLFYWRRKRLNETRRLEQYRYDAQLGGSFDEISAAHERKLQDIFRKNSQTSTISTKEEMRRENKKASQLNIFSKPSLTSTISTIPERTKLRKKDSNLNSNDNQMNQSNNNKNNNSNNNNNKNNERSRNINGRVLKNKNVQGSNSNNRPQESENSSVINFWDNGAATKGLLPPPRKRELSKKEQGLRDRHSHSHENQSVNTNNVQNQSGSDPCLINKVCLKVVNRKECDIDYVAPGVASVCDNQCAPNNPHKQKR